MPTVGREAVADALRTRIVSGLHVGRYRGGERLPSTRALAREFGVNERVVLAAMRRLADEGFVELRLRSGAYVAPPHPAAGGPSLPDLGNWLVEMLLQARARGIAPREVAEWVRRSLETRRVRATCIECNDDQLHLLCSELADDHGYVAESVELDEIAEGEPPLAVRRADLLVTTAWHAAEVEALARRLGKPWLVVGWRPEAMHELGRALHRGVVYYVATDRRFEAKLHRMLEPGVPLENLRVLLVPRDDPGTIPDEAPTFVMPSARAHVTARWGTRGGPGNPIHPPRMLSDAAARDLLTFLVRANMATLQAGIGEAARA